MNAPKVVTKTANAVTQSIGKIKLWGIANKPEIMLAVGITSVVAGTILIARGTLKESDDIDAKEGELYVLKHTKKAADDEVGEDETREKQYRKDVAAVYRDFAICTVKNYALGVTVETVGLGLIIGSHIVLKKRYIASMAAYVALEEAFQAYRARVADRYGEETEGEIWRGEKKEKLEVIDQDTGKTKKETLTTSEGGVNPYGFWFDHNCAQWGKDMGWVNMYLEGVQQYANDMLTVNGYYFLNDALKEMGINPTQAGQFAGWIKDGPNSGDGFVEFDVKPYPDMEFDPSGRSFKYWVEPNCDGNILWYLQKGLNWMHEDEEFVPKLDN